MLELWQESMLLVTMIAVVVLYGWRRYLLLRREPPPSFQIEEIQAGEFIFLFLLFCAFSAFSPESVRRIADVFQCHLQAFAFFYGFSFVLSFAIGTFVGIITRRNPIATPSS